MDKLIWGTSQAITSTLFFLVQLSFLKTNDPEIMAEFSILFGLMNFLLLAVRRSLTEIHDFTLNAPGLGFFASLSFLFLIAILPIAMFFTANSTISICMAVFLFNQLLLDFLRFSNNRNHGWFVVLQLMSVFLIVVASLAGFKAIILFLMLTIFQLGSCFVYIVLDKRNKMSFKDTLNLINFTRMLDFAIGSGFGFMLPLLTIACLDSTAVGVLRTSQSFLSLGSVFTAAFYYSALQKSTHEIQFRISYALPSSLLIGILLFFELFVSDTVVKQIFGPYFQDSLILTFLLIVSLVPTIWVSHLTGILVFKKEFTTLFGIHSISLIVLSFGSLTGFFTFGLESFGLVTIFCSFLEYFLLRRALQVRSV